VNAAPVRAESDVQDWPLPQVPEPSGVAYHTLRKTIFVVGDEGDIAEVSLDGRVLASRHLGGDLEGIACDGVSGTLYAVREGDDVILEIHAEGLRIVRQIGVDRAYEGDPNYLRGGGDGLEGVAVRAAAAGKGEPTFYVVNQYDPAVLAELEVHGSKAVIRKSWKLDSAPLSDVMWDEKTSTLVVVSALWRSAAVVSSDGKEGRAIKLPGFLQEGLARLPDGSFIIAQDVGGLLKWTPSTEPFAHPAERKAGLRGTGDAENVQN
jgi:hypothetical protein